MAAAAITIPAKFVLSFFTIGLSEILSTIEGQRRLHAPFGRTAHLPYSTVTLFAKLRG